MDDRTALLTAIREHPDEDTPRLMYADLLEEQGDAARAEFICTQVALASMPQSDPRRTELEIAERRLLVANVNNWLAGWPAFPGSEYDGEPPTRFIFRRGFVEDYSGYWGDPANFSPFGRISQLNVFRTLRLHGYNLDNCLSLAQSLDGARIEHLSIDMWSSQSNPNARRTLFHQVLEALEQRPFQRLRDLSISSPHFRPFDGNVSLEESPVFRQLTGVSFSHPQAIEVIESAFFRQGRGLEKLGCAVTASLLPAFTRIMQSEKCTSMKSLEVRTVVHLPWCDALRWGNLEELTVGLHANANLTEAFARDITSLREEGHIRSLALNWRGSSGSERPPLIAPFFQSVQKLSYCHFGQNDFQLAHSAHAPILNQLEDLTLHATDMEDAEFQVIATSTKMTQLRKLFLDLPLNANQVEMFVSNDTFCGLRTLQLSLESEQAAWVLVSGIQFPDLHTLILEIPSLDARVLSNLLHSGKFPRLTCLGLKTVSSNPVSLLTVVRGSSLAWVGGVLFDGGDGTRYSIYPHDVYLPNHLADMPLQGW